MKKVQVIILFLFNMFPSIFFGNAYFFKYHSYSSRNGDAYQDSMQVFLDRNIYVEESFKGYIFMYDFKNDSFYYHNQRVTKKNKLNDEKSYSHYANSYKGFFLNKVRLKELVKNDSLNEFFHSKENKKYNIKYLPTTYISPQKTLHPFRETFLYYEKDTLKSIKTRYEDLSVFTDSIDIKELKYGDEKIKKEYYAKFDSIKRKASLYIPPKIILGDPLFDSLYKFIQFQYHPSKSGYIIFSYYSCLPCQKLKPKIIKQYENKKNKFQFIGINPFDKNKSMLDTLFPFPNYYVPAQKLRNYGINYFPQLLFFDKESKKIRKLEKDELMEFYGLEN